MTSVLVLYRKSASLHNVNGWNWKAFAKIMKLSFARVERIAKRLPKSCTNVFWNPGLR